MSDDLEALLDMERALRAYESGKPDLIYMSERVAHALAHGPDHNHAPMSAARRPKSRDTKPAPKPRKKDKRSARHTQRRR